MGILDEQMRSTSDSPSALDKHKMIIRLSGDSAYSTSPISFIDPKQNLSSEAYYLNHVALWVN